MSFPGPPVLAVVLSRGTTALVVIMALGLTGCGSPSASLSGEVLYRNKPLDEGGIRVFPIQGTKGAGAVAPIVGGRFAIPLESGLAPGHYRVDIYGEQKTGRKVLDRNPDTGKVTGEVDEALYLLPEGSTIEGGNEIKLEPGENIRDFKVNSK